MLLRRRRLPPLTRLLLLLPLLLLQVSNCGSCHPASSLIKKLDSPIADMKVMQVRWTQGPSNHAAEYYSLSGRPCSSNGSSSSSNSSSQSGALQS
jgi:hypothetical protein